MAIKPPTHNDPRRPIAFELCLEGADTFSKQVQDAQKENRSIELYSDPFHTHKHGYKLKLKLYSSIKSTIVSVYLIVMRGEYDAILTWPLPYRIKFILLDQKPDQSQRKNIETSITPGYNDKTLYFRRPIRGYNDENSARELSRFYHETILEREDYLVDGKIFLDSVEARIVF